ncbi:DUF5723 family protein [Dyadobacter sp. OTU695]|uniref:DUF5723 family protein n=1 Tax=Dyadobacter sp. OTU695 TaxID=3043860 RepID=UPI00313F0660
MKKNLTVFLLLTGTSAFAQIAHSYQLYDNSFQLNPASARLDTSARWMFNLLSVEAKAGSNTARLSLSNTFAFDPSKLRQNVLGNNRFSNGFANLTVNGPSFTFHRGASSIGLSTRFRMMANFWDVDSRLSGEIGEFAKFTHSYPYSLDPSKNTKLNISALSDIGLTYSRNLVSAENYSLSGGVTVRYYSGLANSSINLHELTGNVKLNNTDETSYLSASTGNIETRTSGRLLDNFNIGNILSGGLGSIGADFGLVYQYKENSGHPKIEMGLSVTDIGRIRYQADSLYSKSYSTHIPDNANGLYFNANFQNSSISQTSRVFDRYPKFFSLKEKNARAYSIGLPTTLRAFVDYTFTNHFATKLSGGLGLRSAERIQSIYNPSWVSVTPRWYSGDFKIFAPLTYQQIVGFNAGLGVQWKQFFLSSGSLISALNHSSMIDLQVGFALRTGNVQHSDRNRAHLKKDEMDLIGEKNVSQEISVLSEGPSFVLSGEIFASATTGDAVPFWMRANRFGSIPLSGASGGFIATAQREYQVSRQKKLTDWGVSVELRQNWGKSSNAILTEAYIKGRLGIFEARLGRSKRLTGLVADSTLSSGSFAISGNALGIPQIELAIPEYYAIPFLKNWLSVKGNFTHGWVGTIPLGTINTIRQPDKKDFAYFHQKSLYIKLGKPSWDLKLIGGFNHQVFWGDTKKIYGANGTLSKPETFWYAVTGKRYGHGLRGVETSKIGNHLGSIDLGLEYDLSNVRIGLYRQNFYDVGALAKLANIRDGLNGLLILNKNANPSAIQWKRIVVEYFYSVNQAGELWSKPTRSGDENYYNNYLYTDGWSFNGLGLGTPLITAKSDGRKDLISKNQEFFVNNRVRALNLGIVMNVSGFDVTSKFTFSNNFGTFGTSAIGSSLGDERYVIGPPFFSRVKQFSGYLGVVRNLPKDWSIKMDIAMDRGKLLNSAFGMSMSVKKTIR